MRLNRNIICFLLVFSFSALTLNSQSVYEVKKTHFTIMGTLGEDSAYKTPYFVLCSDREYPKVMIDAGIHGDEVAGIYACDSIMKYIEITEGSLVLVPMTNIQAVRLGVRGVGVDFNQVFPGNKEGSIYEEKLAYDFMKFVREVNPDLVINLHEAWTRFDENLYQRQKDKSFGQTIITNNDSIPLFLTDVLKKINAKITIEPDKFRIQVFPYKPNHSMDNIIEKLKTPSYTVETLRTLALEDRIRYQIISILAFLNEAGVKFTYKKEF
jgi:hypothetical protein